MKHVVASALLVMSLAAVTPAPAADTVARDCYGCDAPMRSYGSAQFAQLKPEAEPADAQAADLPYRPAPEPSNAPRPERSYAPPPERSYAPPPEPVHERTEVPPPERTYAPPPRRSYGPPPPRTYRPEVVRSHRECDNCDAPRKKYDSVEVVRTQRNVDHSRVVHTRSVVPVYRRPRAVVTVPVVTVVQYVVHRYYVVDQPLTYTYQVPVYQHAYPAHRRAYPVHHRVKRCGHYSGGCSRVLRVGG